MEIAYQQSNGAFASIYVDATIREGHSTTSTVTEHPVEKGANVSDHVRPELERLTLEVFVTNTPIRLPLSHVQGVTGEVQSLDLGTFIRNERVGNPQLVNPGVSPQRLGLGLATPGVEPSWQAAALAEVVQSGVAASVLQFGAEFDRCRLVYEELRRLVTEGVLCRILTRLREYDRMVLRSLDAPRDVGAGESVTFSVEAVQVRLVESETVTVAKPKQVRARKSKNNGPQPATPVEAPGNDSFLSRLFNAGKVAK